MTISRSTTRSGRERGREAKAKPRTDPALGRGLLRWLRPAMQVATIYDIDLAALHTRGIRGVILDLDNTIVPWGVREVGVRLPAWIAEAQAANLRLCIVSNNRGSRVTAIADQLGLPVVTWALKPRRRAIRRALAVMGTTPDATALVGDQVFTDILGGNRLGLHTILVRPQSEREFIVTRLVRLLERLVASGPRAGR